MNYYLADAICRSENIHPLMQEPCVVIFDEAHLLVDTARTMYGKAFQNTTVDRIAEYIQELHVNDTQLNLSLYDGSKKLKSINKLLFSRLSRKSVIGDADDGAERFAISMDDMITRNYLSSLERLLVKISKDLKNEELISDRSIKKAKYIVRMSHLAASKARWLLSRLDLIFWLEYPRVSQKTNGQMAICGIPKNIPDLLYDNVWMSAVPKILTSGTLSIGGDFTHTKKMTGIEKLQKKRLIECTYASPCDYENNTLMYFSPNVPFPNYKDEEYINGLADELERLIRATHGHALILFTSYKVMDIVYGIVRERISDIPLMMLSKGSLLGIQGL